MSTKIRILIIEHDVNDIELIRYELDKAGIEYEAKIVHNEPGLIKALKDFIPDIILSDYSLPSFNGIEAFRIKERICPDIPFIILSGTIGEENAVELIKNGVTDYALKDKLFVLNTKVKRALKEAKENQHKVETEQKLVQSENQLNRAQQLARMGSWEKNLESGKIGWSAETFRIYNCDPETFIPATHSLASLIHPEDRQDVGNWIEACISGINRGTLDYRINVEGTVKYIQAQFEIIFNEVGKPIKAIGTVQDITQRKKTETEIYESEKRYRNIVETAQEGIWTIDEKNQTNFVNKKLADLLGYTPEEMVGKSLFDFMDEEEERRSKIDIEHQKNTQGKNKERCFISKTGNRILTSIATNSIFSKEGRYMGALAMVTDITERKKLHDNLILSEVKIRNFAQHLNKVIEEERAHLAREIHDELGQQLVGIKFGLSSLIKPSDERDKVIQTLMESVDETIQSLRKISTELRPGILDSLGLVPSIKWLASEFERKTKIKCKTEIIDVEEKFPDNISICFFRICQEALTNITKHADASEVSIEMTQVENELTLKVHDNGKGISGEKLENPFSMGLLGMRERANIVSGILTITSKIGKGTNILLKANYKS